MRCEVLIGFAGLQYAGAKGSIIDLPIGEAKSLQAAGIVKMIESDKPAEAYATAEEARTGVRTADKKAGRKR